MIDVNIGLVFEKTYETKDPTHVESEKVVLVEAFNVSSLGI